MVAELEEVEEKLIKYIDCRLESATGYGEKFVTVDVEDIFHRYALDVVFRCFYKQDNVIDYYSEKDHWQSMTTSFFKQMSHPVAIIGQTSTIAMYISEFLLNNFTAHGSAKRTIMSYIAKQTAINLEAKKQFEKADKNRSEFDSVNNFVMNDGTKFSRNMIDYITDHYHNGELTGPEYYHSVFFLFFASNKTSADAISKLIYNLAANQDKQSKLRESILAEGLNSKYLSWCLQESMRLFPPVHMAATRTLSDDIESKFGLIPAGTGVFTPAFTIHRSKEYWGQDADEFRPERWKDAKKFHPMQYMPFGAGKRICPGKEFATFDILSLFNVLMRKYTFTLSPDTTPESIMSFQAPTYIFTINDFPTNIRVSHFTLTK